MYASVKFLGMPVIGIPLFLIKILVKWKLVVKKKKMKKKKKKYFKGQKDNEVVVALFRKHWLGFLKPIVVFMVFLLISLAILWLGWKFPGVPVVVAMIGLMILIAAISYLVYNWLLWWNDVYLLTSIRVINFDQKSLFHRVVTEAELGNIQDITYEINGFWQTIFNFGSVEILTASNGKSIRFENVSRPHEVQEKIIGVKDGKKEN